MRVVTLSLMILVLAGCRSVMDPNFVPSGYAFHNEIYKAPPGPPAKSLGYDYSPEANEAMLSLWDDVAAGLVDRLEAKTGISARPLYVETLPEKNAFNASLDNALRRELTERGYTLSANPSDEVHLRTQAFRPEDENYRIREIYNDDVKTIDKPWNPAKPEGHVFVLALVQEGVTAGEARVTRAVPSYGYVKGEGNIVPQPRVMEGGNR